MSILNKIWDDLFALLFPTECVVCGSLLKPGERVVCTFCRATAPLTGYWQEASNPVLDLCRNELEVEHASAFLFFQHHSGWRDLIHHFKYHGAWRWATIMGAWYGRCLKEGGLYDDVDLVVPLPLHPIRHCMRGYNQSSYLAHGIACELGVKVDHYSVWRKRYTPQQALKKHQDRASNVAGAFTVLRPKRLAQKHILLVDDVMTTGSTLLSCAHAIHEAVPSCRISIAAFAVTRHALGVKD